MTFERAAALTQSAIDKFKAQAKIAREPLLVDKNEDMAEAIGIILCAAQVGRADSENVEQSA